MKQVELVFGDRRALTIGDFRQTGGGLSTVTDERGRG